MEYAVADRVQAAELSDVVLGGMSRVLSDRFFEERIFSDFAREVVYREAEDAFANCVDDEEFVGLWQGEFWGKWILSAVEVYKHRRDRDLLDFLVAACHKLLTYAREDGYLNTYKNSLNVFRVDPVEAKARCNMGVDWNWNIWCRKYTLWGLLAVYEISSDPKILDGARALADQLIGELSANGIEISDTGTFVGLPSCSILKPMLMLYGFTKDPSYLEFCVKHIADQWEHEDGRCPNLITNALTGKRLTEWYENSPSWAKAYEMMSCYEGLCELYRYTGTERYLRACEAVYEILKRYELNPAFSVAYNDVFADAAEEINLISEPCDAIHWMRLCYELFRLTGDVKYVDSTELTYFNAFLGGVFKDGKWGARGIRGAGSPMWSSVQAKLHHQHCCVNNMPRAFMRFAEMAIMQTEEEILVNLYEDDTRATLSYEGGSASVAVGEGYFERGRVTVEVTYEGRRKPISLRVPAWSEGAEIWVDGERMEAKCGYVTVTPKRNSCTVTLDFHISLRLRRFERPVHTYGELVDGKPHWKVARWINRKAPGETEEELFLRRSVCTLTYGPLLLARSKEIGSDEEEMFGEHFAGDRLNAKLCASRTVNGNVRLIADVELTDGERTVRTTVCDYASAGNQKLEDARYFSIYF